MFNKVLAEFIGSAGLLIVVVGSGIMGETSLAETLDSHYLEIQLQPALAFTLLFKHLVQFRVHILIRP